jgi:glycosyltransferase involved in cell wall biosynthesis
MPSLWIVPEKAGGIRSYSEVLVRALGRDARLVDELPDPGALAAVPEPLIHVQHEYALFGSKLPGRYRFPAWFRAARGGAPGRKWVATAHTVLGEDWKYPLGGRGARKVAYAALNLFVPFLRRRWGVETWSGFDGVIVHSESQRAIVERAGAKRVAVIPHFVPRIASAGSREAAAPSVVIFGYFSVEKGQDLAIEAWAALGKDAPTLTLAGGLRREEDRKYHEECLALIRRHGLEEKVKVTGFVPEGDIGKLLAGATLVLAPFRATSGSGSLAMALGARSAILTSDLPLNREIDGREPGALAFYRADSALDLAARVRELIGNPALRASLREAAGRYAERYAPEKIAELHRTFYREVLGEAATDLPASRHERSPI